MIDEVGFNCLISAEQWTVSSCKRQLLEVDLFHRKRRHQSADTVSQDEWHGRKWPAMCYRCPRQFKNGKKINYVNVI